MIQVWIGLLMVLSYFLGSIPSGLIIGKVFKNIDIRQHGSKNTGATNAIRVLGFKYGVWAFVFDMAKGAMVIFIAFLLGPSYYIVTDYEINLASVYGMMAVIGHVWPIYINFKGGKAVATSAGMVFAIEPLVAVTVIGIFFLVFFFIRIVSLSSTIASLSALLYFIFRTFVEIGRPNFNQATRIMDLFIVIILATIIFIRHRANYKRLALGTEYRFAKKKEKNASKADAS